MPLMDEFKNERESIKTAPFKKKLEYFWIYYKWWVIGGAAAIAILISLIVTITKNKKDVVYVAMVDIVENPRGNIEQTITIPFLTAHDYNTKKNTVNFNTEFLFSAAGASEKTVSGSPSYENTKGFSGRESLAIYIAAGDVDAICGSDDWFNNYAYNDFFIPLEDYLTPAELEKYKDSIYYIDKAVLDRYKNARSDQDYEYEEEYPDSDKPQDMEQPIAIGLKLEKNDLYNYNFLCANGNARHIVFGIVRNTDSTDITAELIKYIENGEIDGGV